MDKILFFLIQAFAVRSLQWFFAPKHHFYIFFSIQTTREIKSNLIVRSWLLTSMLYQIWWIWNSFPFQTYLVPTGFSIWCVKQWKTPQNSIIRFEFLLTCCRDWSIYLCKALTLCCWWLLLSLWITVDVCLYYLILLWMGAIILCL